MNSSISNIHNLMQQKILLLKGILIIISILINSKYLSKIEGLLNIIII